MQTFLQKILLLKMTSKHCWSLKVIWEEYQKRFGLFVEMWYSTVNIIAEWKKGIAFVVTTDPSDTVINLAAVQYFLLHHATNKCLAVIRPLQIHKDSPYVLNGVHHLIRVKKGDTQEREWYLLKIFVKKCSFLMETKITLALQDCQIYMDYVPKYHFQVFSSY